MDHPKSSIPSNSRKLLKLQKDIIYGPMSSRRLGRSLGVNLLPISFKLCSMNCCYCQYGKTSELTNDGQEYRDCFPSVQRVVLAIHDALERRTDFDYLTFSGNGEPTLHPYFPQIVEIVQEMKARLHPAAKLALLSNSTTCFDPRIKEALDKIDLPIMKLDAGNAKMFKKVNHSLAPVTLEGVVEGLKSLNKVVIQSMFVQGSVDNSTDCEVESWMEKLDEIRPRWVQIYSLDRGTAVKRLRKVPPDRLQQIADRAAKTTGLEVEVF